VEIFIDCLFPQGVSGAKGSYRLSTPASEQLGSWPDRQGGKKPALILRRRDGVHCR
jgi:hypothetical protein